MTYKEWLHTLAGDRLTTGEKDCIALGAMRIFPSGEDFQRHLTLEEVRCLDTIALAVRLQTRGTNA
jgi:hypothetical protein